MSGAGNNTLKEVGRWKTTEMIDRYAHLSQEHLAQALEKNRAGKRRTFHCRIHYNGKSENIRCRLSGAGGGT
jgi:hypothetical protein